jgi:phosphatidylglycerophosphate synthase
LSSSPTGVEPQAAEPARFQASSSSEFERQLLEHVCVPLVERIPARVHPNTLSLLTHAMVWATAGTAALSPHLGRVERGVALVCAALGVFLSMIGDSIDGMHARRTQQCSKVGELMDHWLDALAVPLAMTGLGLALQMAPAIYALCLISCAMIYQAQLLLYHHTGEFVSAEPTSGVEAQAGVVVIYLFMASLLQFVAPEARLVKLGVTTFGVITFFMHLRCNRFYYLRLGKRVRDHVPFVVYCAAFGALYLAGALEVHGFSLLVAFVSFRICGSYVLFTILKRPYRGNDWSIAVWVVALALAHFALEPRQVAGIGLQTLLPYVACLHLAGRNLSDFARAYPTLQPGPVR